MNYRFQRPELHTQALTHRSLGLPNNERLEFLGDSLVNLLIAELVYENYPKADEGKLTRIRASLVNQSALAEIARQLELGDQIKLGPGELKSGGYRRDSILADAFEALIAAIYLDGGWQACRQVMRQLFSPDVINPSFTHIKDAKTRLQELLQGQGLALPHYEILSVSGEEHNKQFEARCTILALNLSATGKGSSRRSAEQIAAQVILAQLEKREK